ncbi:hypothetical protein OO015_12850 [Thermomicrobium sp. 4228-Ro]|uniref:hypothetical protein n=1 Tax=Thermomicrobium sp. 4228-Ro TaxID=2993937 RepID=UPI00224952CA|nr:hypothetical protein [Thermomicrobium sp. 4228-Ro]MCX2728379.1 hypothetical protein [Thermomicrobium sp. 4228-Ro]
MGQFSRLWLTLVLAVTLLVPPVPASSTARAEAQQLERDAQYLWWARIRGDHWEFPFVDYRPHVLAIWSRPSCYSPQFHGSAGNQDTCSSGHGCIGQWTWWMRAPQSKLGVPGRWWVTPWRADRRNISNYSAVCWFD